MKLVWRMVLLAAAGPMALGAQSTSLVGSKHDLSTSTTPEPCVFCHTPHAASTTNPTPLWNRAVGTGKTFTTYTSQTMDSACPATPGPISMACLGCHDGILVTAIAAGSAAT